MEACNLFSVVLDKNCTVWITHCIFLPPHPHNDLGSTIIWYLGNARIFGTLNIKVILWWTISGKTYVILFVVLVFLLGFISYYAWLLSTEKSRGATWQGHRCCVLGWLQLEKSYRIRKWSTVSFYVIPLCDWLHV